MRWAVLVAIVAAIVTADAAWAADEGEETYLATCAGCHGARGEGTRWAPRIADQGAAGADFMMRTGRMPLRRPTDPIDRGPPSLTDQQIAQIADYVGRLGEGPDIPDPMPDEGDLGVGADLYLLNCASCHGSTGVGAALVGSRNAPSVARSSPLVIAEAVRAGPGPMPAYPPAVLDDHDLDSLVRYVVTLGEGEAPGGWSLGRWGPVAEGAAAWLIGVVAVVWAAAWIEGRGRTSEEES